VAWSTGAGRRPKAGAQAPATDRPPIVAILLVVFPLGYAILPDSSRRGRKENAGPPKAGGSIEPATNQPGPAKGTPPPQAKPADLTTRVGKIQLKLIPAGTFWRGSRDGEGEPNEHPRHHAQISRPFYLSVYEVTQEQYGEVMGQDPSQSTAGEGFPVVKVSWFDAVEFCNVLSQKEDLPTFYAISKARTVAVPNWNGPG
jgi:formylglycine-generating enzyme required for sulfatase activity